MLIQINMHARIKYDIETKIRAYISIFVIEPKRYQLSRIFKRKYTVSKIAKQTIENIAKRHF